MRNARGFHRVLRPFQVHEHSAKLGVGGFIIRLQLQSPIMKDQTLLVSAQRPKAIAYVAESMSALGKQDEAKLKIR
jgi:hypothetical protein